MQSSNWDDFQSEPSEDGAVGLPCTFGAEFSLHCPSAGKEEGEISVGQLMVPKVSFPFLLAAADGGLGLRDHSIIAALLAACQ